MSEMYDAICVISIVLGLGLCVSVTVIIVTLLHNRRVRYYVDHGYTQITPVISGEPYWVKGTEQK